MTVTENFLCPLSRECPHIAKESLKTGKGLALKMAFILPFLKLQEHWRRQGGRNSELGNREGLQKVTFR